MILRQNIKNKHYSNYTKLMQYKMRCLLFKMQYFLSDTDKHSY